jgi:hypothetical protein
MSPRAHTLLCWPPGLWVLSTSITRPLPVFMMPCRFRMGRDATSGRSDRDASSVKGSQGVSAQPGIRDTSVPLSVQEAASTEWNHISALESGRPLATGCVSSHPRHSAPAAAWQNTPNSRSATPTGVCDVLSVGSSGDVSAQGSTREEVSTRKSLAAVPRNVCRAPAPSKVFDAASVGANRKDMTGPADCESAKHFGDHGYSSRNRRHACVWDYNKLRQFLLADQPMAPQDPVVIARINDLATKQGPLVKETRPPAPAKARQAPSRARVLMGARTSPASVLEDALPQRLAQKDAAPRDCRQDRAQAYQRAHATADTDHEGSPTSVNREAAKLFCNRGHSSREGRHTRALECSSLMPADRARSPQDLAAIARINNLSKTRGSLGTETRLSTPAMATPNPSRATVLMGAHDDSPVCKNHARAYQRALPLSYSTCPATADMDHRGSPKSVDCEATKPSCNRGCDSQDGRHTRALESGSLVPADRALSPQDLAAAAQTNNLSTTRGSLDREARLSMPPVATQRPSPTTKLMGARRSHSTAVIPAKMEATPCARGYFC